MVVEVWCVPKISLGEMVLNVQGIICFQGVII